MSMLDDLKTRKANITAELRDMAPGKAGGIPDSKDGGIAHIEYRKSLYEELKMLNEEIAKLVGPWEQALEGKPA